jgi:hypothetical protein
MDAMKTTIRRLAGGLGAGTVCLLLAGAALGAEPAKPKDRTIKMDGETIIIPAEAEKGTANELLLKKFDLNHDGKLDEQEIKAAQQQMGARKEPVFKKTEEGRRLTAKDLYEGGDPARHKPVTKVSTDDFLKQYDVNHDGKIDAAELALMKQDLEKGGTRQGADPAKRPAAPPPPLLPPPAKPKAMVRDPIR